VGIYVLDIPLQNRYFSGMHGLFIPSMIPPSAKAEPAFWFVFSGWRILVKIGDNRATIPSLNDVSELGLCPLRELYLGTLDGRHCYSVELTELALAPEGMVFHSLRRLYEHLDESIYGVATRAIHIIDWDRTHQFCSRCGTRTEIRADMCAKECSQCGLIDFPRISPAVIVLVERDKKVLLARSSRFKDELYSVLAGFVDPGETLEEAVRREVKEEVNIEVSNIRYFGSQPWPFPDSLMIAFTAQYSGGEIHVDGTEILDANWFDPDKLPTIPGKISIARALIDWFVSNYTKHNS
jgi:NAD+ diphosphatase